MKDANIPASEQGGRTRYPGFGPTIRAARMGYHWHDRMQAFVRICEGDSRDRLVAHVTPLDAFMRQRGKVRGMLDMHFCWWDDINTNGDPFALTDLRSIVGVKRPFVATIADDGRVVRLEAA